MLGISSPIRLRCGVFCFLVLLTISLASCSNADGPTAAQAGQTLKSHVIRLLKERNAQNVTVTDPGGRNLPCAEGQARQTFAAEGADLDPGTNPDALNDMLVGALKRVATYSIVSDSGGVVRLASSSTRTNLTLNSRTPGVYVVRGETECLPVG
ncbi:hypothetical protein GCM10009677_28060 [Sphaerisporangium rubeum]